MARYRALLLPLVAGALLAVAPASASASASASAPGEAPPAAGPSGYTAILLLRDLLGLGDAEIEAFTDVENQLLRSPSATLESAIYAAYQETSSPSLPSAATVHGLRAAVARLPAHEDWAGPAPVAAAEAGPAVTGALRWGMGEDEANMLTSETPGLTVLSQWPGPRVFEVDGFLSDAEVAHVLGRARDNLEAGRFSPTGETGVSMEMPVSSDAVLGDISRRLGRVLGFPNGMSESNPTLRVRRYVDDQMHPIHTDTYAFNGLTLVATMLTYLTSPEKGGDTFFPVHARPREGASLDIMAELPDFESDSDFVGRDGMLSVRPKAGKLLVWLSCTPEGDDDPLSLHGSRPMVSGEKWTATSFVYADRQLCLRHLRPNDTEHFVARVLEREAAQMERAGNAAGAAAGATRGEAAAPPPPPDAAGCYAELQERAILGDPVLYDAGGGGCDESAGRPPRFGAQSTEAQRRELLRSVSEGRNLHGDGAGDVGGRKPRVLSQWPGPRVWLFEGFADDAMVDHLLGVAEKRAGDFTEPSQTGISLELPLPVDGDGAADADDDDAGVLRDLTARMYDELTGIGVANDNDVLPHTLRMRRYRAGTQENHPLHTDTFDVSDEHTLLLTMMIYLTDVEEGGDTFFPRAHLPRDGREPPLSEIPADVMTAPLPDDWLRVRPRRGDMLVWSSCTPDGGDDRMSLHGSRPVLSGTKWTATNFVYANKILCRRHAPLPRGWEDLSERMAVGGWRAGLGVNA